MLMPWFQETAVLLYSLLTRTHFNYRIQFQTLLLSTGDADKQDI